MKTLTLTTKRQQLTDILKKEILSGKHTTGSRFYSQNELVELFNVSQITVREALSALAQEGLLTRSQGKGTFVTEEIKTKIARQNTVGMFMVTHGHVYETLSKCLINGLSRKQFYPVVIEPVYYGTLSEQTTALQHLLDFGADDYIFDGVGAEFPFDFLAEKSDIRNILFIHRFENTSHDFNADFVLADYHSGGYQVMKHLCGLGHRKISLFTFYPSPRYPGEPLRIPDNKIHMELVDGCHQALREIGLDPGKDFDIILDVRPDQPVLEQRLTSKDRPTAIFAYGDERALEVFRIAKKYGLRIPADLSIIGYHNTPWVNASDVPLTSVSIEEEEIAGHAVRILGKRKETEGPARKREKIMVKPKLIIRKSTAVCQNT